MDAMKFSENCEEYVHGGICGQITLIFGGLKHPSIRINFIQILNEISEFRESLLMEIVKVILPVPPLVIF